MIDPDNVYHVLPIDDLREHIEVCIWDNNIPYCRCACNPTYLKEGVDGFIVIHNSFDGREHFEYPSKVRDN